MKKALFGIMACTMLLASCKKDDNNSTPITLIEKLVQWGPWKEGDNTIYTIYTFTSTPTTVNFKSYENAGILDQGTDNITISGNTIIDHSSGGEDTIEVLSISETQLQLQIDGGTETLVPSH